MHHELRDLRLELKVAKEIEAEANYWQSQRQLARCSWVALCVSISICLSVYVAKAH